LPFGLKILQGFSTRTTRIPLSISPHKNTDLIFIDRLKKANCLFQPINLLTELELGVLIRRRNEVLVGIITLRVYLYRPSVRNYWNWILFFPISHSELFPSDGKSPNETVLPTVTQSCSRQYEIGFFCRFVLPSEGNTFSRRNEIRKMKILLSVGGIAYTVVSAEGGVAELYSPMEWIYRIVKPFFYKIVIIGIIIEIHL
jgi:hypothetical protein